ncbi:growth arrest and DNA damage-inducible protein GADD45 alpha isoform X1 [Eublepharis macularius]|uniref:Growth arrest and DNA damage-inducible protein GADD45 alpha n=1 Tax=Eublepharis macularius TaxID=481883 RepID=A0AA97JDA2_EUBMA|nr:growth arrest and DNA damage-inducible protein GADD45 alpha isoform X1 [Eublepharis macularius]
MSPVAGDQRCVPFKTLPQFCTMRRTVQGGCRRCRIAPGAVMHFVCARPRLLPLVRSLAFVSFKILLVSLASFSMEKVGDALEEVLSKALSQRNITIGVYEAAKLLNVDPDNVVLCLLAADEEDNQDVALQIHFTLIQAFCCENDINILRVSNPSRLAELLLLGASGGGEQPADLHCILVTNPHASQWKDPALSQLICFCRESRYMDQWVPVINLPER